MISDGMKGGKWGVRKIERLVNVDKLSAIR